MQAGLRSGHQALHGFAVIVSTRTASWAVGLQGPCTAHRVRASIDHPRSLLPILTAVKARCALLDEGDRRGLVVGSLEGADHVNRLGIEHI